MATLKSIDQQQEIDGNQYITQVSEEIKGRVAKKLSKEFSWTEGRISCAVSRLHELLLNPLIKGHFGTAAETSRNTLGTNQRTNEDDSQSDSHPKANVSQSLTARNSGPEDGYNMVTGAPEEITYSSPGTSEGEQNKTRLANQRKSTVKTSLRQLKHSNFWWQFSSWQTEAKPQNLLTIFTENRFAKITNHNKAHVWRTSEKFHCLKTLSKQAAKFRTIDWRQQNQQLPVPHERDARQTFKNINRPTQLNLGETSAVFCSK